MVMMLQCFVLDSCDKNLWKLEFDGEIVTVSSVNKNWEFWNYVVVGEIAVGGKEERVSGLISFSESCKMNREGLVACNVSGLELR
jgi:hypothetical protein